MVGFFLTWETHRPSEHCAQADMGRDCGAEENRCVPLLQSMHFSVIFLYDPELIAFICPDVGIIHSPNFRTFPQLQIMMIGFIFYLLCCRNYFLFKTSFINSIIVSDLPSILAIFSLIFEISPSMCRR